MKKIRFLLLVLLALALCAVLAPSAAGAAGGFHITDFNVDITLQENNVYDVTQVITVDFNAPLHGIYCYVPLTYKWDTPEGKKEYRAFIYNADVSGAPFETYTEDGIYHIRIGDPDRLVTGKKVYTVKYSLDVGDDWIDDYDFLYYNIIGTQWEVPIDNVSFTIRMPKAFDASGLQAYSGKYGSTQQDVRLQADGNVITGSSTRPLSAFEGITVYTELPEGYFVGERTMAPLELLIIVVMGGLVLLGLVLFLLFGVDRKPVRTVEFEPPDGLTSAEVGYVIDGSVDNRDAVSLIIYWAEKGYLEIEEKEKNALVLRKLKDLPDTAKPFERTFFDGLFANREEVSVDELKYTFYDTMTGVKSGISAAFESKQRRVFTKRSLRFQALLSFFTALPFVLSLLYANYIYMDSFMGAAFISLIPLVVLLPSVYILGRLMRGWRGLTRRKRAFQLAGSLIFLGTAMAAYLALMFLLYNMPVLGIAGVAATLALGLLSVFMRKRTDIGVQWLGRILGLKNFIATAEKSRLEMLVNENPQYFYKILPYAYVLGVSEAWAKRFENIGIQPPPPVWYHGYGMSTFTTLWLMHSLNRSLYSMGSAMAARPSPKGGTDGFGGGGFSGGGFGGGGGGGW